MADGTQGLAILSGDSEEELEYRGSVSTSGYAQWVELFNDDLLLADGDNGLLFFNLKDPLNPKLVGRMPLKYVNSIKIFEGYVFVTDKYRGFIILELKS